MWRVIYYHTEKRVQQQWSSPAQSLWLERLFASLRPPPPARSPPPQIQSAHSSGPSSTRRITWVHISLSGRMMIQMVSLRYPALFWLKLLLFRKNLAPVTGWVFGCAMQSRWWSCGIRLVSWTWVWSLALLGAWCIPANEGKNGHGNTLGLMRLMVDTRMGFTG